MSKRRQEHVQQGRSRPADTNVTATVEPGKGDEPAVETPPADPIETNRLGKYWIAIILWAVGFATMIAFEVVAAVFRR